MSADNWAICPKCILIKEQEKKELSAEIDAAYGRVSQQDYLDMVARGKIVTPLEPTLREDYWIGLDEDNPVMFEVSYAANCSECGFKTEFHHTEIVDILGEREKE